MEFALKYSFQYYAILGVDRKCDPNTLKKAYLKASLETHPDKGGNPEAFKAIKLAYDTLSDPTMRTGYDRTQMTKWNRIVSQVFRAGSYVLEEGDEQAGVVEAAKRQVDEKRR